MPSPKLALQTAAGALRACSLGHESRRHAAESKLASALEAVAEALEQLANSYHS